MQGIYKYVVVAIAFVSQLKADEDKEAFDVVGTELQRLQNELSQLKFLDAESEVQSEGSGVPSELLVRFKPAYGRMYGTTDPDGAPMEKTQMGQQLRNYCNTCCVRRFHEDNTADCKAADTDGVAVTSFASVDASKSFSCSSFKAEGEDLGEAQGCSGFCVSSTANVNLCKVGPNTTPIMPGDTNFDKYKDTKQPPVADEQEAAAADQDAPAAKDAPADKDAPPPGM